MLLKISLEDNLHLPSGHERSQNVPASPSARVVVVSTLDFDWFYQGSNPCYSNDIVVCSNYYTKCKIPGSTQVM